MEKQRFQVRSENIAKQFAQLRQEKPERLEQEMTLSFSTWMFGTEDLEVTFKRIRDAGLEYVELPGNHHTKDLGLSVQYVRSLLNDYGLKVSGICGLYSPQTDFASDSPYARQNAIDYVRREIEFASEVGAEYIILVPSAVGRPQPIDAAELERSVETVRLVGDDFLQAKIKAGVEPIRSAEVSLIHTIADTEEFIRRVDHPGISHINGDIYHLINEEEHVGEAIIQAGDSLVNLHLADSHRGPLGTGVMDVDDVIRALYLIGHNQPGRFVTGEALGIGGNPYELMSRQSEPELFDQIVKQTIGYFRQREKLVVAGG
ncbi:MAG: sugar phosphate isomerase/epimerase [Firmicutes bacterium]|nr:sugar phosphate isomerase/epimerase [Bacillota bacterium]